MHWNRVPSLNSQVSYAAFVKGKGYARFKTLKQAVAKVRKWKRRGQSQERRVLPKNLARMGSAWSSIYVPGSSRRKAGRRQVYLVADAEATEFHSKACDFRITGSRP